MERKHFEVTINAPKEKVWEVLWSSKTYEKWTSAFGEGSKVKTDWKKGSKAVFLDAKNGGMVSTIADNRPNEFMSIKHLGTIKNGVEDYESPQTREWAGALENYTLKTVNGKTELAIDMDVTDEYKDYFEKSWPKALSKVKELAEKN